MAPFLLHSCRENTKTKFTPKMSLFAYYAAINIEVAYHGTFISILARI